MKSKDAETARETIRAYLARDLLDGHAPADSDELLLSGLLDSIGAMRLVAFLKRTFAIDIPPEHVTIETLSDINAIVTYVGQRRTGVSAAGA